MPSVALNGVCNASGFTSTAGVFCHLHMAPVLFLVVAVSLVYSSFTSVFRTNGVSAVISSDVYMTSSCSGVSVALVSSGPLVFVCSAH